MTSFSMIVRAKWFVTILWKSRKSGSWETSLRSSHSVDRRKTAQQAPACGRGPGIGYQSRISEIQNCVSRVVPGRCRIHPDII